MATATEVIVTVTGDPSVTVDKFSPYIDQGASAVTDTGVVLTVHTKNPVKTDVSGTYVIEYTATDPDTNIEGSPPGQLL